MTELIGLNLDRDLNEVEFSRLLSLVSNEKKEQVLSYRFPIDATRCLLGNILVRFMICRALKEQNAALRFGKNKFGKPFLLNNPDMNFNISHSGKWVVCALDSLPVGVDVEEIKEAPFDISERFFSLEERTFLFNEPEEARNESFYYIWTLKESYIKAIGQGLSYALDSFAVLPGSNWIKHKHGNEEKNLWCDKLDERHVIALCAAPGQSRHVEKMTSSEFIQRAIEALV